MEPLFEHRRRFAGFGTRVLELEGDGPAIVLVHGWSDSADTWRYLLDRFALVERDPVLRRLLAVPVPLPERAVREAVGRVYRVLAFANPGAIQREAVDLFTGHHRDRGTVRRNLDAGRRLIAELQDPFALERVTVPVLLIWGERDLMVSASGAERVMASLPETQLELLPGVGHCPQIEAADRVAELLLGFPAKLRRAA